MALIDSLWGHPILTLIFSPFLLLFIRCLYRISPLHPLSRVPGPILPRLTSLWLTFHAYAGDEVSTVHALHLKYGRMVRTGPNSVDIRDGDALKPIYSEKGGFKKADHYSNFDIDGHRSIFSEVDTSGRAPRAKAVVGIFSTINLRQGRGIIEDCVDDFVSCLNIEHERSNGAPVNVLALTRALAVDVVTSYLFGTRYGGLESVRAHHLPSNGTTEPKKSESGVTTATGMIDCFVAVGQWWYLPKWAFKALEWADTNVWPDEEVGKSIQMVDDYLEKVVSHSEKNLEKESLASNPSYQARLLHAGFSESETRAQCKDLIFAGTDSTGMNLGTICFMLVKHPDKYERLRTELAKADPSEDDLQANPYLYAVVREGLRMSLANPSRLPRVVPNGAWTFKDVYIPAGTVVSCTPFELHFDESVFEDPHTFRPERWLNASDAMNRDAMYFGLGPRQCIARNLATLELLLATCKVVQADALRGAICVQDKIEIMEWFNSKVKDEKIEIRWDD